MHNRKLIGIDAGRTWVKLAWLDETGEISRRKIPAEENSLHWEKEEFVFDRLTSWAAQAGLDISDFLHVVIGAAGALEYECIFTRQNTRIQLYGDVSLAARSCGIGDAGLMVICGTGGALVRYGSEDSQVYHSYGPVIGDLWGGAMLGREALRHLVDQIDRSSVLSGYARAITEFLGAETRSGIVHWANSAKNVTRRLGHLGKITIRYAEKGDEGAAKIGMKMTDSMAKAVKGVLTEISRDAPVKIGVQGSIIEKSGWVRQRFGDRLREEQLTVDLILPRDPLDLVALRLAERL
ncbi:MAG: hypothetical protein K9N46_03750 [Candidatus Marinimicrobia bacterium]|nr:hypothetical protein [Candidatus Neomarinimicrobiota bacterium]MCF7829676.1 hypothetical protein [Candidatus Neomarinimicrobiota bacterium]MCF7879836.1 hypothetical protein [Candidatus Neomarinimicrobiota bacterium]